jgi:type IV secretion system protein TrbB
MNESTQSPDSGDSAASVRDRAERHLARTMGSELLSALADPKTVEVVCNADGKLWVERLGEPMRVFSTLPPSQAQAIIETVAGLHQKVVTRSTPLLEAELPDGSRFAGQLPPVVPAPTFAIRKRAIALYTMDDYVAAGSMSADQRSVLIKAVTEHRNILVVGGTGSGKTTLINALIHQMVLSDPAERVIVIEDTAELQCRAPNYVQYHTTAEVSMTALLRTTLRMRPDRILVGEVRGPEALDLLMSWNTGHEGGAATLHSNSARTALDRLKLLISMHPSAPQPIEPLIATSVHMIVHITRSPEGRKIREISELSGFIDGQYVLQTF